jgi:hypothetical protein
MIPDRDSEWLDTSLAAIFARYAKPIPPRPPAPAPRRRRSRTPDRGALAERMTDVAQDWCAQLRTVDAPGLGKILDPLSRQELYGLLVVVGAMADIDRPVAELLAWADWEMTEPLFDALPRSGRELVPCGTTGAWARHYANGEEPCEPCKAAKAVADAASRDARNRRRRELAAERRRRAAGEAA